MKIYNKYNNSNERFKIKLCGSFCLSTPNDKAIPVPSKKARALIAILAVSPNGECTRTCLQNKLWSRGSAKDSLRKELSNLRKLFESQGLQLFSSNSPREIIKLNIENFDIDINNPDAIKNDEFLAGLDIPGEEMFEDWLRLQRSSFDSINKHCETEKKSDNLSPVVAVCETLKSPRIRISVDSKLTITTPTTEKLQLIQSTDVLNRIVSLLMHTGGIDLYDKDIGSPICDVTTPSMTKPPHAHLHIQLSDYNNGVIFSIRLQSFQAGKIICSRRLKLNCTSQNYDDDVSKEVELFIVQTVDEILFALTRSNDETLAEEHFAARLVHIAVENLFTVTPEGLDIARSNLDAAIKLDNDAVFYAWRAYTMTHYLDDPRVDNFDVLKEEAISYVRRALEIAPYNPLVLSLLTHVYSFGLKQFDQAFEMINQANALGSEHVMTYDAQALLKLYTGNLDQAKTPAVHATKLSRFLPYRHCFMTTLCMINGLQGDFKKAIDAGELSLRLQNTGLDNAYPPTVRYLAASYKMTGEFEKAFCLIESLNKRKKVNPASSLKQTEHIIPSLEIGKFVSI